MAEKQQELRKPIRTKPRNNSLQFNLRELLFIVLFTGLGLGSLRVGGMLASAFVCVAVTMCLAIAIIAFVGRDHLKSFAIGFMIPLVAYGAAHFAIGESELDPYRGKLPTTQLLRPMFDSIVTRTWIDTSTGKELPNYDPVAKPALHQQSAVSPFGPPVVSRK